MSEVEDIYSCVFIETLGSDVAERDVHAESRDRQPLLYCSETSNTATVFPDLKIVSIWRDHCIVAVPLSLKVRYYSTS